MTEVSRRHVLQVGVGGALALAAAGGVFRWVTAGYALRAGEVAIGLSEKQLCVARALVEALLPAADALPDGVSLGIHQRIDEQVWAADPHMAQDLRDALELIEHVPPLLGHWGRFTSLPLDARVDVFQTLLRSRRDLLVQIALAFKQLVHILYYAQEAVWPHIGYDGPWEKTPKPPESSLRYRQVFFERGGRA